MNIQSINNSDKFCQGLLDYYVSSQFGAMGKRDIEMLLVHLLQKDGQFILPRDLHKACRLLRVNESRMRGLMRDSQLKYNSISEHEARRLFVNIVENAECSLSKVNNKFSFIIRDPMLRLYVEEWVAQVNGFSDSSFNTNVFTVEKNTFTKIVEHLTNESEIKVSDLKKFETFSAIEADSKEDYIKLFTDEFVKSLGSETVKLSLPAFAGGFKLLFGLI